MGDCGCHGDALCLFPVMVSTQQTTCMAHVQPELQAIKLRYASCVTLSRQEQQLSSKQMKRTLYQVQSQLFRAFSVGLR
jgi:membrane protein insertase Oxa1/YidC/SpoIIIJ